MNRMANSVAVDGLYGTKSLTGIFAYDGIEEDCHEICFVTNIAVT
jgi:hypothetical protein